MKLSNAVRLFSGFLAFSAACFGTTLNGNVTNGTMGKPAAGDDVVLLQLAQGMSEQARTKTDSQGKFKFDFSDDGGPHLVRVLHQGVNYFPKGGPVMPGTTSVDIQVYDVAKKVAALSLTVDMMRFAAENGTLSVTELWAVSNTSSPPRTQMNDRNFQIELPEGAQIDGGMAAAPGGQPINSTPAPTGQKNQYAFVFPLRPGETRFQLAYHLPYSGQAAFSPKLAYRAEHVVLMLPKTMQFAVTGGAKYQPMGEEEGAMLQVITGVQPGQNLAFKVSGNGVVQQPQESGGAAGGESQARMGRGRPGGGLGPPEETPDPLHRYRWFILGGLAVALALGGFYVVTRQPAAPRSPQARAAPKQAAAHQQPVALGSSNGRSDRVLDALKEELFALELDRHEGRISREEYEKSKAALDHTIARAAARSKNT